VEGLPVIDGYFDDIVTDHDVRSPERTITESDIVGFAGLSGDWHPLHTSIPYAASGPFGERIAHGMLVLSVATGLIAIDRESVLAFYGIDKLRFVRPTRINETVHALTRVTEKKERDESSGTVSVDFKLLNQDEDVVISAVFRFLVSRKP
jgi:3-hydroxybutyryl-CoA dehydratase